ncbi:MAG: SMP-30/gluconolactonase/LRE family protein [Candidatus Hydrogenedentales bacterium]|jgi:gluconolactonase
MTLISLLTCLAVGAAESLVSGPVELVCDNFQFTEGPLYLRDDTLIFSDIPADTIFTAYREIYRKPSGQSNGLTLDSKNRLICCEHKTRRVTRTEEDGSITVLAEKYQNKRLNSPNDVVVHSSGTIYFTDPPYGLPGGLQNPECELGFSGVYKIDLSGNLVLLDKELVTPNGLAFSPDENNIYIADTQNKVLFRYDVVEEGNLANKTTFCSLPGPDGLKVDNDGNVWSTASDGLRIYNPSGELIETVAFPEVPANCAFGAADSKTLFVTARKSVYKIQTLVVGIQPAGNRK